MLLFYLFFCAINRLCVLIKFFLIFSKVHAKFEKKNMRVLKTQVRVYFSSSMKIVFYTDITIKRSIVKQKCIFLPNLQLYHFCIFLLSKRQRRNIAVEKEQNCIWQSRVKSCYDYRGISFTSFTFLFVTP